MNLCRIIHVFLPYSARSAECIIAMLMLSVCDVELLWSYRLGYRTSKVITQIISLEPSLF